MEYDKVVDEYCWPVTQAVGVVVLWPIRCHCVGVGISAGLLCIYLCSQRYVY